jgi:hypothetical protein
MQPIECLLRVGVVGAYGIGWHLAMVGDRVKRALGHGVDHAGATRSTTYCVSRKLGSFVEVEAQSGRWRRALAAAR